MPGPFDAWLALRGTKTLPLRMKQHDLNGRAIADLQWRAVARDRWLGHMRAAVESLALAPLLEAPLWDYLERAAFSLVNTFEETP